MAGPELVPPPLIPISLRNFSFVLSLPKFVDSHLLKEVAPLELEHGDEANAWLVELDLGATADEEGTCVVGKVSAGVSEASFLLLHSICLFLICSAYLSGLMACGL